MLNNVNTFNAAKATKDADLLQKHNYLIDILQQQLKILQASIANGITVTPTGTVELGLASSTTAGALSASDWGTFNGKQDHSTELDALSALADTGGILDKTADATYQMIAATAISDFIVSTAAGAWAKKTLAEVQALVFGSGSSHVPVTINATANGLSVDASQVLALALASASTIGALSSTDWNTFNNKQAALTFGIADTNKVQINSATVASGEYAKFTATGLESISLLELSTALNLQSSLQHYEPLTNGDIASPEFLFANGDILMGVIA